MILSFGTLRYLEVDGMMVIKRQKKISVSWIEPISLDSSLSLSPDNKKTIFIKWIMGGIRISIWLHQWSLIVKRLKFYSSYW